MYIFGSYIRLANYLLPIHVTIIRSEQLIKTKPNRNKHTTSKLLVRVLVVDAELQHASWVTCIFCLSVRVQTFTYCHQNIILGLYTVKDKMRNYINIARIFYKSMDRKPQQALWQCRKHLQMLHMQRYKTIRKCRKL